MSKELKISPEELNERLKWPLYQKVKHCIYVFLEFYFKYQGRVYLGFSGGKDSQVLDFIIRGIFRGLWQEEVKTALLEILNISSVEEVNKAYHELIINSKYGLPERVFCDTGLEFPELRKHVKTFDGVVWLKPKMKFPDVIKNVGVAVASKKIAMQIRRLKDYLENPSEKNEATRNLFLTGVKRDGSKSMHYGLPEKWKKLLDAPFKVSDKCCDIFKKEPWERYRKMTGKLPITATTVVESMQRRTSYLATGCNSFDKGREMCRPYSIFTEKDTWDFAKEHSITFCEVYYDRFYEIPDGFGGFLKITVSGEKRTGCMFCLFGIHLEPKDKINRFQRLAITHPKQYEFMVNKCGIGYILDFIGIRYKVTINDFLKGKQLRLF